MKSIIQQERLLEERLQLLSQRLFGNIQVIQKIWVDIFGSNFDISWSKPEDILKYIVIKTKKQLDISGNRTGHTSLFIRDPLSDRLILRHSTNSDLNPKSSKRPEIKYIPKIKDNYDSDGERKYCFYNLYDRVTQENRKGDSKIRKKRGLTGWVAVTGSHLMVNSEKAQQRLDEIIFDLPKTKDKCRIYGTPLWGNRISEFALEDPKTWTKRYLAVPIKSFIEQQSPTQEHKTIGVIRYTCLLEGEKLDNIDLFFLESIAELISAIINLDRVKLISTRDERLLLKTKELNESGDIREFLEFIAHSLNSQIVSLYIPIKIGDKQFLRLFDAYGISGETNDIRNRILDYEDTKENWEGLTLAIFHSDLKKPKVLSSVLDSNYWKGKNTIIFYEKALESLGIKDIKKFLQHGDTREQFLRTYTIRLMGMKLGNETGVLKVEFPLSYDSDHYYDDPLDEKFFINCCKILGEEMRKYQLFLSGKWFKTANENNLLEFIRLKKQIMRTLFVTKEDAPEIYRKIDSYIERYKEQIITLADEIYNTVPKEKLNEEQKSWSVPSWTKEAGLSVALKYIIDNYDKVPQFIKYILLL